MSPRGWLKRVAERVLVATGMDTVARRLRGHDFLILAYHNVVPHEERAAGETSLHLAQKDFADQLDALADSHDVVDLDALLTEPPAGSKPRAAVTFDDAYQGALTAGLSEATRRGLPVTVFVSPGLLGRESFWWDALTDSSGELAASRRERALEVLFGKDDLVREWARDTQLPVRYVEPNARPATEAQLMDAAGIPGVRFGSHTWSHPNLSLLDGPEVLDELVRSRAWLTQRFDADSVSSWISYPYGLVPLRAEELVREAGYRGGLRIDGGCVRGRIPDASRVPRLNVPAGMSLDGFRLRLAGLLGR